MKRALLFALAWMAAGCSDGMLSVGPADLAPAMQNDVTPLGATDLAAQVDMALPPNSSTAVDLKAAAPSDLSLVAVHITSVMPQPVISPNGQLTIQGDGFSVPSSLNQITIGGVDIDATAILCCGTSTELTIRLPQLEGLDTKGTDVLLSLKNAQGGEGLAVVKVAPFQAGGAVNVLYQNATDGSGQAIPPDATLQAGTYRLAFLVSAEASGPGVYTVGAVIGAGWTATIDGSDQLTLDPSGDSQPVTALVTVPDGASPTDLLLFAVANSNDPNLAPGMTTVTLTPGGSVPQAPAMTARLVAGCPWQGYTMHCPQNQSETLSASLSVTATVADTYDFSFTMRDPSGWMGAQTTSSMQVASPGTSSSLVRTVWTADVKATSTGLVLTATPRLSPTAAQHWIFPITSP